jgi:hypothetical protein
MSGQESRNLQLMSALAQIISNLKRIGMAVMKKLNVFNCKCIQLMTILTLPSCSNPYLWDNEIYNSSQQLPAHPKYPFTFNLVSVAFLFENIYIMKTIYQVWHSSEDRMIILTISTMHLVFSTN